MVSFDKEPAIKVGLITGAREVRLRLSDGFITEDGKLLPAGDYFAKQNQSKVSLGGPATHTSASLAIFPTDFDSCQVTVHDVTIGVGFHWQRQESQSFQGTIRLRLSSQGINVINELPVESYLVSVISSEMSASCPTSLLRAHAVVSRSWLLAQLSKATQNERQPLEPQPVEAAPSEREFIKWYDRENHEEFDVCADDHCQRYQGASKAFSESAHDAVKETRGAVLTFGDEICDTRYSKSCGGMTEIYGAAWEDKEVAYLPSIYDGSGSLESFSMPLTNEANAEAWMSSSPPAYCNTRSAELLARILPGFDQETGDFYRWVVSYTQDELQEILRGRTGEDFGRIAALTPVSRGESGRITRLKIVGEKKTAVIGKELEIRKSLSRSHLYSSAFVVRAEPDGGGGYPSRFELVGAGWGHGVGLCQIGAAVMADLGISHEQILAHYFRNATLSQLY